jgi:hypothetical protein
MRVMYECALLIRHASSHVVRQGAPGVSNTAGAALWALDYALFAYVFYIGHNPSVLIIYLTGLRLGYPRCVSQCRFLP